jgi:hypothetical protein
MSKLVNLDEEEKKENILDVWSYAQAASKEFRVMLRQEN